MGVVPEWVAEMTCRFWRGEVDFCALLAVVVPFCGAMSTVLVVVVAYTHTLWRRRRRRRRDCVVGRGWMVLFPITFNISEIATQTFCLPSFHPFQPPQISRSYRGRRTSPSKSEFTPSLPSHHLPSRHDPSLASSAAARPKRPSVTHTHKHTDSWSSVSHTTIIGHSTN